ncbi:unnamed protein product [Rotaria sordida]|uniref:Uncharacterized protein n=1 Tax=Rotaria sordida TaxID=392033 RepID=A0A819L5N5_9BILA|nr:unnamed protein product [Rotaria sordida]
MTRIRHKNRNRYRYLCIISCFIIGCSFFLTKFNLNDLLLPICLPQNPDNEIVDRQDEWQYQNSITGQWYHWRTVYKRQNNPTEWRVNWLNVAPKSYLGVIVYLATYGEFKSLQTSLAQLSRDLSANDIQQSLAQTLGNHTPLTFERIKFSNSPIQPGRAHRRWSPKYFHMCRFFTLMLPNHPLLTLFSFYWRLDTHSYIFGQKSIEDPFDIMQKRKIQYAFTMANIDDELHTEGLWSIFHEFLKEHCLKPSINFRKTQTTNVSLFRDHSLIRAWLHKVDRNGGIYRHRWGDAPIHTLILTQLISRNQLLHHLSINPLVKSDYIEIEIISY